MSILPFLAIPLFILFCIVLSYSKAIKRGIEFRRVKKLHKQQVKQRLEQMKAEKKNDTPFMLGDSRRGIYERSAEFHEHKEEYSDAV